MEPISVYTEARFQVHCIGYFSKRNRKPAKFEKIALLLLESKCLHRKIVSSCLAGRFLVRFRSGSGRTYTSRMGIVRLFLCSDGSENELKTNPINLIHPQINENNLNKKPVNRRKNLENSQKYRKKSVFPLRKPAFERLTSR